MKTTLLLPLKSEATQSGSKALTNLENHTPLRGLKFSEQVRTGTPSYRINLADSEEWEAITEIAFDVDPHKGEILKVNCEVQKTATCIQSNNKSVDPKWPVTCELCQKVFQSKTTYKMHYRTHTGERPFSCGVCKMNFKQSGHLKSHLRRHTGEKPYKCDKCGAAFIQRTTLKNHIMRIHGAHRTKKKPKLKTSSHRVKNFYCKYCDKTFIGTCYKVVHMRSHFPKEFECKPCEIKFKGEKSFLAHLAECRMAGTEKDAEEIIKEHLRNGVSLSKLPPLAKSRELFVSGMAKVKQVANKGNRLKIYFCMECRKKFYSLTNLTIHIRSHTGERPYRCEECGAMFRQIGHLRDHNLRHTGVRPYMCTVCKKTFSRTSNANVHASSFHKGVKAKIVKVVLTGASEDSKEAICLEKDDDESTVVISVFSGNEINISAKSCEKNRGDAKENILPNVSHKMLTNSRYICNICKRVFPYSSVDAHFEDCHVNRHVYICNACGLDATDKVRIDQHIEAKSVGKGYLCCVCPFSASRINTIKSHIQRAHSCRMDKSRYFTELRNTSNSKLHKRLEM